MWFRITGIFCDCAGSWVRQMPFFLLSLVVAGLYVAIIGLRIFMRIRVFEDVTETIEFRWKLCFPLGDIPKRCTLNILYTFSCSASVQFPINVQTSAVIDLYTTAPDVFSMLVTALETETGSRLFSVPDLCGRRLASYFTRTCGSLNCFAIRDAVLGVQGAYFIAPTIELR